MITKEQLSIFDKQFWQAVADNRIQSIADAKKYAMDWISTAMGNNIKNLRDENERLRKQAAIHEENAIQYSGEVARANANLNAANRENARLRAKSEKFLRGWERVHDENACLRAALEAIIDRYDVANMLAGDDPIIEPAKNALK